ncbi:hypothetical protein C8J57DRAFT_1232830 [Mycena rebaudengoi]|nr:hypothetical protein C8J57DRAFT_1232830 [Mycena rebaudengoi]
MFRVSHQEPDRLSLRVITTAECEIIRVIKCYVALDYEQDLPTATQPMPSFTVEQNNDSPPDRLSPPATSGSAPPKMSSSTFIGLEAPGIHNTMSATLLCSCDSREF